MSWKDLQRLFDRAFYLTLNMKKAFVYLLCVGAGGVVSGFFSWYGDGGGKLDDTEFNVHGDFSLCGDCDGGGDRADPSLP